MDSQGSESGPNLINPAASSAYMVLAALYFPPNDPDTPKPPAGPDDDCDGDPNA